MRFNDNVVWSRLFIILFLSFSYRIAAAADFYQVSSGNHNDSQIWSSTSGGTGGAGVPGSSDVAHLEGGWNLTLASNWSVAGLDMSSSAGTLSAGNYTLTVGASHFSQAGGVFSGGSGALVCSGNFTLTGGTYTSPPTQTIKGNVAVQSPATFNHSNGQTNFSVNYLATQSISAAGFSFYNVAVKGYGYLSIQQIDGDLSVEGDLSLGVTDFSSNRLNGGRILAKKNVVMNSPNFGTGNTPGTCTLVLNGTADQTIDGSLQGHFPSIEVNKPSGKVFLQGAPQVYGSWNWVTAQDLVPGVSTLTLATPYSTTQTFTPGTVTYGNLIIKGWGQTSVWNVASDVSVGGTLTFDMVAYSGNVVNGASFTCYGDVVMDDAGFGSASWGPGTSSVKLVGSGNHAVISNSAGHFPNFTVDTDGTVTTQGDLYVSGNWTFTKGTWSQDTNSKLILEVPYAKSQSITPGNVTYGDVSILGWGLSTQTIQNGPFKIGGSLSIDSVAYEGAKLNGGTAEVSGNFSILGSGFGATDGGPGTATIKLKGSSQTVTANGTARCPTLEIASTGSVTFSGNIHFGESFVYTSGTINTNGSTATFLGRTNTTITGNAAFGNLVIQKGPYGSSFTVTADGDLHVENALSITEGNLAVSANRSIAVAGNVTIAATNASFVAAVPSSLTLDGTSAQSVDLAGKSPFNLNVTNTSADVTFLTGFALRTDGTSTIAPGVSVKFGGGQNFTLGRLAWSGNNNITVQSTVSGQAFHVKADAYQSVRKIAIQDCDASLGPVITAISCTDNGGNTNIEFLNPAQLSIVTPAASLVSPAWVEGTSSSDVTSVTVSVNSGTAQDAVRLNPNQWYLDNASAGGASLGVALSPSASTHVEVTAANAANESNTTAQDLTWNATDLIGKSAANDVLKIRSGDSVLFVADTGYEVDPDGLGTYPLISSTQGQKFPHQYYLPGTYTARIRTNGQEQGSMTVKVVGVDFQGPVACEVNYQRTKDVVVTPASSNVDLSFTQADPDQLTTTLNQNTATGAKLNIKPLKRGSPQVVARLGGTTGPIAGLQQVDEFTVDITARTNGIQLEHAQDFGYSPVIIRPYMPGIKFSFDMFASTSTFDGGATHHEVFSDSFVQSTDAVTGETIGTYSLFVDMNTDMKACFTCVEQQGANLVGVEPSVNPCGWDCIEDCQLLNPQISIFTVNGIAPGLPNFPAVILPGDQVVYLVTFGLKDGKERNRCTGETRPIVNMGADIAWNITFGRVVAVGPNNQQTFIVKCMAAGRELITVDLTPKAGQRCPFDPVHLEKILDIDDGGGGWWGGKRIVRFPLFPFGGLSCKYRGVDIHGVPRPEASPTGEGESDRIPNMAYVDMYNLAPYYSVTDSAVPVEGGEMVLEFRRTCSIRERRTTQDFAQQGNNLLYASEGLLGLGWDANLGSHITVVDSNNGIAGQKTATVVDDVGNQFIYRTDSNGNWRPKVAHSFASESVHNILTGAPRTELVVTRTFGTKLYYRFVSDYYSPNVTRSEEYYRLERMVDRNGNELQYVYQGDVDDPDIHKRILISEIHEKNHPERKLLFEYINIGASVFDADPGYRLSKVISPLDPANRETRFTYFQAGDPDLPDAKHVGLLKSVEQPAVEDPANPAGPLVRPKVSFTYHIEDLQEQNLNSLIMPEDPTPWNYRCVGPNTITDARGHVTSFTYVVEKFPTQVSLGALYTLYTPRLRLSSATTVDGTMHTDTILRTVLHTTTKATDTRGTVTEYDFVSTSHLLPDINGGLQIADNGFSGLYQIMLIYAQELTRTTKAGQGNPLITNGIPQDLSAKFEWADDPNLNLVRTTDLSGNVIEWSYDSLDPNDAYNQPFWGGAYDAIVNPRFYQTFNQPARRVVDPTGLNLVTEYRYETTFDKLIRQIDAEGKATDHQLDAFGNRFAMIEGRVATPLPNGANGVFTVSDGSITRTTRFFYETQSSNPPATPPNQLKWGFITKTVDPDGRVTVFDKQFDPLDLLAHCTLTSIVQGYDTNNDFVADENLGIKMKSVKDIMGNTRSSVQPRGFALGAFEADFTTSFEFDNLDRQTSVTKPAVDDPSNPGNLVTSTVETHYDLNSNAITVKDDNGNISHAYFDLMNRVTFSRRCMTADTTRHETAPGVLDVASIPNDDIVSESRYNEVGLVKQSVEPNGVATLAVADDFITDFAYDELLRLTLKTLPKVTLLDNSVTRYTETYQYGANAGSGAFTILSGWNPTRVINRRGYASDTTFDNIYRAVQSVRRIDNGAGVQSSDSARAGEPATLTVYNKVHKPIRTTMLNEDFSGTAQNQVTFSYYDDLHRPTVSIFDFDGDGPGLAEGSYVNDASSVPAGADADDFITRTVYDNAGHVRFAYDAEDHVSENLYDGAGRVFESRANAVDILDTSAYNTGGSPVRPGNNARVQPTTKIYYDLDSNKEVVEGPNHTKVKTTFDRRDRAVTTVTDLNNDGTYDETFNGADIVGKVAYDLVGNAIHTTDSRGNTSDTDYDKAYRVFKVTGPAVADVENGNVLARPATQTVYDHNSKVTLVLDPRNVTTKTIYDELNRARKVTAAFGTPVAVTTESQYDANNNVTALILHNKIDTDNDDVLDTDDDQVTSYEFDTLDRQTKQTLPDVGDALVRSTQTTYYRVGNIRTVTDPKSQVTESEYDRANRTATTRFKRADTTVEETRTFAYNKVGKPLTVTDLNGTTTYAYDELYRLLTEIRATTGQTTYAVDSFYDAASNRTKCIYPQTTRTLTSVYDRLSRLTQVTDSNGSKVTGYTYDSNSNRKTCVLPNGVTDTFNLDALNRVSDHTTTSGASTIYQVAYQYDLVGNRHKIDETVQGQATRNLIYAYDDQYRLTSESWTGNSYAYTFDLAGNRLKLVNDAGGSTFITRYSYDRLNRLTSDSKDGVATNFGYDLNGSRISKTVIGGDQTLYGYDVHDRLVTASVNSSQVFAASYDYRTRRLTKTEGGSSTYFCYDGGDSFQEIKGTLIDVEYVRGSGMGGGIGSILYSDRTLTGGGVEYFTYNAVGHTVALTNNLAVATKTDLYEAYGNISSSTGFSLNNRLANTKERDASIGLDNHGFRYYDPEIGRYISADPMQHSEGFNWYVYVENNPNNRIDPLGLGFWDTIMGYAFPEVEKGDSFLEGARKVVVNRLTLVACPAIPIVKSIATTQKAVVKVATGKATGRDVAVAIVGDMTVETYEQAERIHENLSLKLRGKNTTESDRQMGRDLHIYDAAAIPALLEDPIPSKNAAAKNVPSEAPPVKSPVEAPKMAVENGAKTAATKDPVSISERSPAPTEKALSGEHSNTATASNGMGEPNPGGKGLHRPYIRKWVVDEVERRAPKTSSGEFIDPNTNKVIEGKYDMGHEYGNEFRTEKAQAEAEGLSQEEFNDRMNDPDKYRIEDRSSNRGHKYEKKD